MDTEHVRVLRSLCLASCYVVSGCLLGFAGEALSNDPFARYDPPDSRPVIPERLKVRAEALATAETLYAKGDKRGALRAYEQSDFTNTDEFDKGRGAGPLFRYLLTLLECSDLSNRSRILSGSGKK